MPSEVVSQADWEQALGGVWTFLDLTPFGRQEEWEDSPSDAPQGPLYQWWRRHTEYPADN